MFRVTHRQLETWELVAQGLTNKQIAQRMNVSERTVEYQVSIILSETGMKTRSQIAVLFLTRRDEIQSSKVRKPSKMQQVISLLQEGKSVDAIAQELNLSRNYVYKLSIEQKKTPREEGVRN
ncbi:MAG: hypothetical protein KatS3mg087_0643 [Patescibacteria group bacterium]|nr:MAG: hypothetical protein KatS3mg087_0643 [Patescibacteria group bacterium]